jgi:nitrous oxide reductase accessory protein NosL
MLKKLLIACILLANISSFASLPLPKATKTYVMDYDKNTECLVRHFKVYKDPRWAAKIELQNGKKIYFSSPKSMFEFYHRPGKWFDIGVHSEHDFKDIIVTDYNNLKLINARDAYYIYGSHATSPGGDDLVVFESREEAAKFAKDYNGKRIMTFEQVSQSLINLINGRI